MKQQILLSLCNLLPGKSLRHSMRDKVRQMSVNSAKIGASYSVWDGEELLEASIKCIRSEVDYINIVWQKISWYGKPCHPDLEKTLEDLKRRGLIDELVFFEPDLEKHPQVNEVTKRDLGLQYAKKSGCTHFMTMDTDEFYYTAEFAAAKKYILENDFTHTACCMYMYADASHRYLNRSGFFVPLLYKIGRFSNLSKNSFRKNLWFVDPTKQMPYNIFSRFCFLHNIDQHHFANLRKDLRKKFENSATIVSKENIDAIVGGSAKDNPNLIDVGNIFNIHI